MTLDELSVLLDGIAPVVHEELVERDAKIASLEHRLAALEVEFREKTGSPLEERARAAAESHFSK
jgi:hypothetical protein